MTKKKDCKIKDLCPTQFCDTCKPMDKYAFETELYMIVGNAKATRNPKQPHFYSTTVEDASQNYMLWCSHEKPKRWHWASGWSLVKVKVTGVIKNPDKHKEKVIDK